MAEWGAIAEQDLELLHVRRHAVGRVRAAARPPDRASPRTARPRRKPPRPASPRRGGRTSGRLGSASESELARRSWTPETRKKLIDQYKDGYRVVAEALVGATDEELDARPAPGKWTAREIVHHLADSEMTSAIRLRAAARRRQSADPSATTRTSSRAGCTTIGRSRRRSTRSRRARRSTGRSARLPDRGRVAARGHSLRARPLRRRALARDLRRARPSARRADPRRARTAAKKQKA